MSFSVVETESDLERLIGEIRREGVMGIDLEFNADGKFIPELCLFQVALRSGGPQSDVRVFLVDCMAVEPEPLCQLVADEGITTIGHALRQDLMLLRERYGIKPKSTFDTQIASALTGLGDQIGYAKAVESVANEKLDKGPQFTDWTRRPLEAEQLDYAAKDVVYLHQIHDHLTERINRLDRAAWVREECEVQEAIVSLSRLDQFLQTQNPPPRRLRRNEWERFSALLRWRIEYAYQTNRPLGWIAEESVLLEVARRAPKDANHLRRMGGLRDLPEEALAELVDNLHDKSWLAKMVEGIWNKGVSHSDAGITKRTPLADKWQPVFTVITQAVAESLDIPQRFLANRGDLETIANELAQAKLTGGNDAIAAWTMGDTWKDGALGCVLRDFALGRAMLVADDTLGVRVSRL